MSDSNPEPRITTEMVFSLGGEGGSIRISRQTIDDKVRFIYYHNEFDTIADETLIDEHQSYSSFEQSFQQIQQRYRWYRLYLMTVHEDYRSYVADRLVERLNQDGGTEDELRHNLQQLEDVLGVKLNHRYDERSNRGRWDWQKSD
jgi:shikimate kinase